MGDFLKRLEAKQQAEKKAKFETKAPNIGRVRAAALKSVDATLNNYRSATPTKARKSYKINADNGAVEWTLPVPVNGVAVFYETSDEFEAAVADYREWLASDKANGALEAKARGEGASKLASGSGKGWSPERRARFEATQAAKKAKK